MIFFILSISTGGRSNYENAHPEAFETLAYCKEYPSPFKNVLGEDFSYFHCLMMPMDRILRSIFMNILLLIWRRMEKYWTKKGIRYQNRMTRKETV